LFLGSLVKFGCFHRADLSAVSALDAGLGIDLVFTVTLADALYRTLGSASAAGDTVI
jgi:hypothetical protein